MFGVVNPVFSFTLSELSRVLSQAELSGDAIPTPAFLGNNSQARLIKLRLLTKRRTLDSLKVCELKLSVVV